MTIRLAAVLGGALFSLLPSQSLDAQGKSAAVSLVRELRLGGETEDFSNFYYYTVSPTGIIAVSQPQDQHIIFFDRNGRRMTVAGRKGKGPGEFTDPALGSNAVGWLGDSLWVLDAVQRQLSLFGPDGRFIRKWTPSLTTPDRTRTAVFVPPRALYADGSMLAEIGGATPDVGTDYSIVSKTGDRLRTLFHAPSGGWVFMASKVPGRDTLIRTPMAVPFSTRELFANSPDGMYTAVIEMPGRAVSVTLRTRSGAAVCTRSLPVTSVDIPSRVADSIVGFMRSRPQPRTPAAEKDRAFDEMRRKIPATYAPVLGARIGYDGTILLRMFRSLGELRYLALDATCTPFADFTLPITAIPMHVSRTNIWLLERDTDGLPSVLRYRLNPAR